MGFGVKYIGEQVLHSNEHICYYLGIISFFIFKLTKNIGTVYKNSSYLIYKKLYKANQHHCICFN